MSLLRSSLVGQEMRDGFAITHGIRTTRVADSGDVTFIDADDTHGLTAVRQRYREVRALQLVWPDSTGAYPWDAGYRNPPEAQPLLGVVADTFTEA